MKIIYDKESQAYLVALEASEMVTWINTDKICEARKEFLDKMAWMFDSTIREKLVER